MRWWSSPKTKDNTLKNQLHRPIRPRITPLFPGAFNLYMFTNGLHSNIPYYRFLPIQQLARVAQVLGRSISEVELRELVRVQCSTVPCAECNELFYPIVWVDFTPELIRRIEHHQSLRVINADDFVGVCFKGDNALDYFCGLPYYFTKKPEMRTFPNRKDCISRRARAGSNKHDKGPKYHWGFPGGDVMDGFKKSKIEAPTQEERRRQSNLISIEDVTTASSMATLEMAL
ncbi:hypothetical protein COB55_00335 [Candidatus Wolfebacteria bacterium]|nr:MAG: hypothetical protein COB55_00335 [Candidatus Wolfebacteria bacterium]